MESVAKQLKKTNFTVRRFFDASIRENVDTDLTMMQSWILMQMAKSDKPICQKDLEQEFCVKKSSISSTISLMESKGYIIRMIDPKDNRKKVLTMSEKAKELTTQIQEQLVATDKRIEAMLSEDDALMLISLLEKIRNQCEKEEVHG